MNIYMSHSNESSLQKLTGKISSYEKERLSASFVFAESDQTRMGVLAVAYSATSLTGQAAIMSHYASSIEEEADYVQFVLDGKQIKGWLWRSPFKEGDEVVAAVEKRQGHYELYGMMRPIDKVISLYPHCSRGKQSHIKNAIKWWFIFMAFVYTVTLLVPLLGGVLTFWRFWIDLLTEEPSFSYVLIGLGIFFMVMVACLTRKWMPFMRLAQKVFRALELPSPSNIDLKKSTKLHKTETDPPECGVMYFKY